MLLAYYFCGDEFFYDIWLAFESVLVLGTDWLGGTGTDLEVRIINKKIE